jgi:hypothetical protein
MSYEMKLNILFWASFVALGTMFWLGTSFMEARTFSRLTGREVSTIDAMFIQLRVQEPAKFDRAGD